MRPKRTLMLLIAIMALIFPMLSVSIGQDQLAPVPKGSDSRQASFSHPQTSPGDLPSPSKNTSPSVIIKLSKNPVVWETPVLFSVKATDPDGKTPRVMGWDFGDGMLTKHPRPHHTYQKWNDGAEKKIYTVSATMFDGQRAITLSTTITVRALPIK